MNQNLGRNAMRMDQSQRRNKYVHKRKIQHHIIGVFKKKQWDRTSKTIQMQEILLEIKKCKPACLKGPLILGK